MDRKWVRYPSRHQPLLAPEASSPPHPHFMSRFGAAPAKLLRKTTLVEAAPGRLPVHTLTFADPDAKREGLGVRIDYGDVVKVMIPHFKPSECPNTARTSVHAPRTSGHGPREVALITPASLSAESYSMSAERAGEFDITFKLYPGGRCSGYLDSIQVGQSIDVFGMTPTHL